MKRMTLRKGEKMRETARDFMRDEAGMGTVEIILIIVVLIGLVIIFKKQLNDLVKKVFQKISSDSNSIISAAGSGKC
jgi:Flp pilus assembly pilin Flp